MPNCGECLWTAIEVVELRQDGTCPRCGADYSAVLPRPVAPLARPKSGEPDPDEAELEDLIR